MDGEWIPNLQAISDHTALFHNFSGSKILALRNGISLVPEEMDYYTVPSVAEDESKQAYESTFKRLMEAIKAGRFEKVILSRTKTRATEKSAINLFEAINNHYSNTFNYLISNEEIGTWLGATPERLLTVHDTTLSTMSLAGTKMPTDEWTPKEYREQALVTETIVDVLGNNGCTHLTLDGPKNLTAGKIEHLYTSISGQIKAMDDWKKIAEQLHPTPAVCGLPTSKAKQFIPRLELHDRQFYTGFLGLIQTNKIQLFVNLRCMQYFEQKAKLYIGGGIISNSTCEAEWRETERKSETLGALL